MTETTTKAAATKSKQPAPLRGRRVIVWNPERDYRLGDQAPLKGYEMVRQYVFCWVDDKASKLVQQTTQPQFKELILEPGLNWIEADLWATAASVSAERHKAEQAEGNPKAVDEIDELLTSRAILAFKPNEQVESTRRFTGNFEDYEPQELRRLMAQVDDVGTLQGYAKKTQDFTLTQVIQERIEALSTGY
ncbi:hypothetical protein D0962_04355 [Leptolyngbyaceae cyanobacterium CCMR0082]|uniref:Uncharacterized protein n=1 Tax=Adonisia turfae CCMR0082 TaxID=2304604 RepID=A0A6M0S1M6_9CYAN|nr:hypothetical protein [Adonisia turfae]NEZ62013.1 hypothetical protein [Adonisia turfae CCMR0082]